MATAPPKPRTPFGDALRDWRKARGMSQLDLALAAEVSTRHISFIETGRARPSRDMVLRLADTLELPLRERNTLLLTAGFAPRYRERDLLADQQLEPVRRALDLLLESHEPYPAFVLDADWNIVKGNRAHHRMLSLLLPGAELPESLNVMQLVLDLTMLKPVIANWEVVAGVLGRRLQRQIRLRQETAGEMGPLQELLEFPGVREAMEARAGAGAGAEEPTLSSVVIPVELEVSGQRLSWFSTIATFGTAQDVTVDELRIESLFPADEETERIARGLVSEG